tara:strand:+ start:431 stop:925 length:495 start_codon:yes stop_codon:yes gene_type:complete
MPQLNPEFFISQLFWLILSFVFLLLFLWKISLPRISSVLEKRENKINDDISQAKQLQAEAEEIQKKIDIQLQNAKSEASDLIKNTTLSFHQQTTEALKKLDDDLSNKLEKSTETIENNKTNSLQEINNNMYEITKLILSKISRINTDEKEIKETVDNLQKNSIN